MEGTANACLVQRAKSIISSPGSLYEWAEMSAKKYREVGGEDSPVEDVLRRCFIRAVEFCSVQCLPELYIELHGGNKYYLLSPVDIHPLVFAFFLQYLCYNKLGRQTECNETLYELSILIQHDGRYHNEINRDISWEILGICQQMNGDNPEACHSYLMALHQQHDYYWRATCIRLGTILARYF